MICNYPPQSLRNETQGKKLQVNNEPVPGDLVSHVKDEECLGVVVAVDGDVVTVMWSKRPWFLERGDIKVQTTTINATARKLKTKWSIESDWDLKIFKTTSVHRVR